MTLLIALAAF